MAILPLAIRSGRAQDGLMTPAQTDPPTVEVLLFPGVDELDAVGPYEILAAAGLPVRAVGLPGTPATVRGANGLALGVDGALGARPGVVIVPGGGWLDGTEGIRTLVDAGTAATTLAELHAAGTVLASVCTGALLLAAAGVLEGRPAVTNRHALDDLRATGADVRPEARVVDAGSVLTAGGPLAGVDLAIRLVERLVGDDAALAAAERVEHERRGPLVVEDGVAA
jgi:transcriptional regulator GlxA family with amidase domain